MPVMSMMSVSHIYATGLKCMTVVGYVSHYILHTFLKVKFLTSCRTGTCRTGTCRTGTCSLSTCKILEGYCMAKCAIQGYSCQLSLFEVGQITMLLDQTLDACPLNSLIYPCKWSQVWHVLSSNDPKIYEEIRFNQPDKQVAASASSGAGASIAAAAAGAAAAGRIEENA